MTRLAIRGSGRVKGAVISRARGRLRWQQVRDASIAGRTREEAADEVGMSISGLKAMLIREAGSSAWPIRLDR